MNELDAFNIPIKRVPDHLPVSYRTVLRWIAKRQLAVRRIGGRLYTSQAALLEACPVEEAQPQAVLRDREVSASAERVRTMLASRRPPLARRRKVQS